MKSALLAGATGLIGEQLLSRLLSSSRYSNVIALSRRALSVSHPKLRNIITSFDLLEQPLAGIRPDDIFCCLGTTMAKAGSKEKFYQVDFEYPYELAKITFGLGAKQYLLVSALGANKNSGIYYNRVKGELEEAIRSVAFECIHIVRPSLLLGARSEKRPGEDLAKFVYKYLNFAIPGKYMPIQGSTVAEALVYLASKDQEGVFIHESRALQRAVAM